jgi:phosphatidylglycerol lysyltransferase
MKVIPFLRRIVPVIKNRYVLQVVIAIVFVFTALYFIRNEQAEMHEVVKTLKQSQLTWIAVGLFMTALYVILQALMYVFSFRTIHSEIRLKDAVRLFLKRSFISVFLPAGGVSSLAFFTGDASRSGASKTQIHIASTIYGVSGIFSVFIVAIPTFIYIILKHNLSDNEIWGFLGLLIMTVLAILLIASIRNRGFAYNLLIKHNQSFQFVLEDLADKKYNVKAFVLTNIVSVLIEFTGVAHLMIAMIALGYSPSLETALIGYIVATAFLIVSPVLRGVGAIELSLAYILNSYGFPLVGAISVTFLYRFFEFWFPLALGLLSFTLNKNNLFLRVLPAMLVLILGVVNIFSVLTPAIDSRVQALLNYIPIETINASNILVMVIGIALIYISIALLKGYKNAWFLAIILSIVSSIGHIVKGIDYEEATLAGFDIFILLYTRKHYFKITKPQSIWFGVRTALITVCSVLFYGVLGFYFIEKKHFALDFSLMQSVETTFRYFFMVGSDFVVYTSFARDFVLSIQILGALSMCFLLYTIVRPFIIKPANNSDDFQKAKEYTERFGNSTLDYFKTYFDKQLFFSPLAEGFISYKICKGYAVVLEKPVCEDIQSMKVLIYEFDRFCLSHNLKNIYYRVDAEELFVFKELKKKWLLLGQEGVVDLIKFSLEGGERKSLRNAINNLTKKGFHAKCYEAPVKTGLLQKLKTVSNEWLTDMDYDELAFSQGVFDMDELKNHTIITIENDEEKVLSFLDIIPDYCKGEGTYDLIRKTSDAPGGALDYLTVEAFKYLKSKGFEKVNIGLVPMSGITETQHVAEQAIKFAYKKLKQFAHYKGMRSYKEKFEPEWINKYIIFDSDYDLFQLPVILNNVMKISIKRDNLKN